MLCSWARHFALTVPLSTQEYKRIPANCWSNLTEYWGVTCDGLASHPGGSSNYSPSHFSAGSYEPVWLKGLYFTFAFALQCITVALKTMNIF